ncbi:pygopus homolog 2-like [Amphiura filiformis]|uniref:pygopus homolog 2-like n=1 Tax=Amphiura filiformis TaxID=82378 RepID=UPI003B220B64
MPCELLLQPNNSALMPKGKKTTKRSRASSESDAQESIGIGKISPNKKSPGKGKKRRKSTAAKETESTQDIRPPEPPQADNIFAANPFEDNPASQNLSRLSRHMNRRMSGQFPNMNMNSNFGPRGMMPPPSRFPMGHMGPSNGPMNSMMMRHPCFPCGVCRGEVHVSEDAITCESSCNQWYHRMCTGLTEAAYTLLTTEHSAQWVCDKCVRSKQVPLMRLKPQQVT